MTSKNSKDSKPIKEELLDQFTDEILKQYKGETAQELVVVKPNEFL